jgi:hypothetical protein
MPYVPRTALNRSVSANIFSKTPRNNANFWNDTSYIMPSNPNVQPVDPCFFKAAFAEYQRLNGNILCDIILERL